MRLKAKIAVILVLPMLLLSALLGALLWNEMISRFVELERDELVQNHQRLEQAIDAEFDALRRLTRDWAYFDDTYAFIAGDNPDWVEANFTAATFDNLRLDGILVFDLDATLVSGFSLDAGHQQLVALEPDLVEAVAGYVRSNRQPQQHGMLRHRERVLQLALSEVRDSDGSAAPRGTLVMLRYHDQGEVDQLAQRIRLQLQFIPIERRGGDPALAVLDQPRTPGLPALRIDSEDQLSSLSMLPDLRGDPLLVMQVSAPRQIYREGRGAVSEALLFALGAQWLMAAGIFIAIHRAVLRRLSRMARRLSAMGDGSHPNERLSTRGNDEIDQVGRSLNGMLDRLQEAETRRREQGERQRRMNAVLVEMATDESILDGRIDTLLQVLRGSLARGVALRDWSLWFEDEADGLHCLGSADPSAAPSAAPDELSRLLAEPGSAQQPWLQTPWEQAGLCPFVVESRIGALLAWRAGDSEFAEDERNFLIAAAQLVERSVLANRLAGREAQLKQQAEADPLTGLANRAGFERELALRLQDCLQSGRGLGLLFIDLDRFKPVNDRYGHAVGDWLLREVGQRLRDRLRAGDLVARLGGDEFTIILSALKDLADCGRIADKLVAAITEPFLHERGEIHIGCSVGVACAPQHGRNVAELLASADHAMYRAKQAGRGAWRSADELEAEAVSGPIS